MSECCLIDVLKRLKFSSKEAVENLDEFSTFKRYLHVARKVQEELFALIMRAHSAKKKQLILVCGGVGDGKSHLISCLKHDSYDIVKDFYLHNDATESFDPKKSCTETLNQELDAFSDEKINDGGSDKIILAINLGTLNNFIDSKYGKRFSKLKEYVKEQKILDLNVNQNDENNPYDENSNFQYINFSDYHMYTLTKEGTQSKYMKALINKVTCENDENQFSNAYKTTCMLCDAKEKCPVKYNYEFLKDERVQSKIVDLLIECIIKNKIIISTRALLDFIYNIIVENGFNHLTFKKVKTRAKEMSSEEYLACMLPNIMFTNKDASVVIDALENLDPINNRSEAIDRLIITLNNTENILNEFSESIDIDQDYNLKELLDGIDWKDRSKNKALRNEIIKYFLRLHLFKSKNHEDLFCDTLYKEYVKNLYYWNIGKKNMIKKLSKQIEKSIYLWNGETERESVNLVVGKKQSKYKISQKLNISGHLDEYIEKENKEIHKFINELILEFKKDKEEKIGNVHIDFQLYKLLSEIREGYRPNKKDRTNYINFVEFINHIMNYGNQAKELTFTFNVGGEKKQYKLEFDSYDDFIFVER